MEECNFRNDLTKELKDRGLYDELKGLTLDELKERLFSDKYLTLMDLEESLGDDFISSLPNPSKEETDKLKQAFKEMGIKEFLD